MFLKSTRSKRLSPLGRVALAVLATLTLIPAVLSANQAGKSPVKIFILVGQSNMLGQASVDPVTTPGTLAYTVANDPDGSYQFLVNDAGDWVVRDDVWIRNQSGKTSGLTTGYGSNNNRVGPEIGFGHAVGDLYENQVLIVKAAWGGKSLGNDFLPPSSAEYPTPTSRGDTGYYYQQVLKLVEEATTNLGTYFPDYDGNGYEIAGFCWHQGWNDRVSKEFSAAYETNMANFIKDIRRDLGVPEMPFVIATSAMDSGSDYTQVEQAQLAMANAAAHPAFEGNVKVVDARQPYNGLTFMQPVKDSPRNEGYHWNRNAKTYTNLGLAMADAMSVMVPARCPYRLKASGDASGVTLSWQSGTDAATSVQVRRDSKEIAAAAPVGPASYLDAAAVPGLIEYELNFNMFGESCAPLRLTFNAGITELEAYRVQQKVRLTWTNNLGYTKIEVRRDGALIDTIAGDATAYTDTAAPASGHVTYSLVPTNGRATPAELVVNLDPYVGNCYIYEPFAASAELLSENQTGPGLEGRWSGSMRVVPESLSYGALPTYGNQVHNPGKVKTAKATLRPELAEAGLLDHGAELWFSFLTNNTAHINTAVQFCLGTEDAGVFYGVKNGGEAIGVNISSGATPQAATWAPKRSTAEGTGTIETDATALIVGKITWGADDDSADTIEIYLPAIDLLRPASPVSSKSAVLNQSQFNTLSFSGKNQRAPEIDEIRFGSAYADVVPANVARD